MTHLKVTLYLWKSISQENIRKWPSLVFVTPGLLQRHFSRCRVVRPSYQLKS